MKFEVHPELASQLKWNISLCLTIPPVAPNVFPVGQAGIICNKEKILIFMHLTRSNVLPGQVQCTYIYLDRKFFYISQKKIRLYVIKFRYYVTLAKFFLAHSFMNGFNIFYFSLLYFRIVNIDKY